MTDTNERNIDFYFDYISHNAYLAWHVLPNMAEKYGYTVRAIPALFAGFLKAYGQLGPAEVEPKIAWMNRNNLRKAIMLGLPFKAPKRHPFHPLFLLRLTAQDMPETERNRLTGCLLRGVWADALDPNDADAVCAYLEADGIEGKVLIAGASSNAAKDQLRTNTDTAIARGGFGVPTMIVDNEVFWGYDDLVYLEGFLAGKDPLAQVDIGRYLTEWRSARTQGQPR